MSQFGFKRKHLLYAAAFFIALSIRSASAGQEISTDAEAALALQALAVSQGQAGALLPHPAYLALTAPLMYLFGGLDWAARFWPVVAGSLLVLTPALFQRRIGPLPAVLLAFLIAIDPGMVAVSLQVGSYSLALLFVLLALGFWLDGRPAPAGGLAGLALLGGPPVWPGLLGLWAALALSHPMAGERVDRVDGGPPAGWRTLLVYALGTFLFAGSLFFFLPQGLSAAGASLPEYLRGWVEPAQVPARWVLLALLLYGFFPLALGLYGAVAGWLRRERIDLFLLLWFSVALALALAYPGRQVSDLAWPLLPLLALTARQLARLVSVPRFDRLATLGQAVLVALILGFISITIVALSNRIILSSPQEYPFRLAGAGVLLVASTGLIAWGWSRQVALKGFAWGAVLVLFLYTVSSAWNVSGLAGRPAAELWTGEGRLPEAHLLRRTIDLTSQWAGLPDGRPELVVAGLESPVLRWSLRAVPNVRYVSYLSGDSNPPMIITGDVPDVALGASYRGQGFLFEKRTNWNLMEPLDWSRWMVSRAGQSQGDRPAQVILWVRTDLFPGDAVAGQMEEGEPLDSSIPGVNPR